MFSYAWIPDVLCRKLKIVYVNIHNNFISFSKTKFWTAHMQMLQYLRFHLGFCVVNVLEWFFTGFICGNFMFPIKLQKTRGLPQIVIKQRGEKRVEKLFQGFEVLFFQTLGSLNLHPVPVSLHSLSLSAFSCSTHFHSLSLRPISMSTSPPLSLHS